MMVMADNLQSEIEQFLYTEAELLDDQKFEEWLTLFTDDCSYKMPIRETSPDNPSGLPADDAITVCHFDDNKAGLTMRYFRLTSESAHSEIPPSRTRRMVSNVRVSPGQGGELDVRSNLILFQSRREGADSTFVGERRDRLRRVDGEWRIARRIIVLDHNVLPRSLSIFF